LVRERFITIAREARSNYAVLLIDEAQDVSYKEWQWLTSLQNKLDWSGFRLSVISVGTQQMAYKHELFGNSGDAHVAARFMVESARFHGLCTVEELRYVLNGYDVDSEWPVGSKTSFLKHFAPESFDQGRQLAETAENMWAALCELSPNMTEFPMQHVAFAVENTLSRLARGMNWDELTSKDGWKATISGTSLDRHIRLVTKAA
jgi:hypothetical protein